VIVVDDRLLFEILAGTETPDLAEIAVGGVATPFSWYYRLSRAISSGRVDGSRCLQIRCRVPGLSAKVGAGESAASHSHGFGRTVSGKSDVTLVTPVTVASALDLKVSVT
jgi:hypothetical protein